MILVRFKVVIMPVERRRICGTSDETRPAVNEEKTVEEAKAIVSWFMTIYDLVTTNNITSSSKYSSSVV